MRKENELALARAEMRMVRWISGIFPIDGYSNDVLRDRLGLEEGIILVLQRNRLGWCEVFGY